RDLRLHEPAAFVAAAEAEALPLRFRSDTPIVTASLQTPAGTNILAEFEIDSGCDSGVCLGREFVERHGLLEGSEGERAVKSGVGGSAHTYSSHVRQFRLGRFTLPTAQADFFLEGSPAGPPLAGHIGLGVLREFRVTFDYSRRRLILEK
ncbi:MAG TPA: retropepsin-like aspartic protease, partial [Methylomirabilota bacterium]|nr:retropepsin-like aspartic protease [Methylomirabilota bacterium]